MKLLKNEALRNYARIIFHFFSKAKSTEARRAKADNSGITLLEIIVAMSILIIVLAILFSTYINSMRIYQEESVQNKLQVNIEIAMRRIIDDIKKANTVASNIPSTSYSIDNTSPYAEVVLRQPEFDDEGEETDCRYIYYKLDAGKITKVTADCSGNTISTNIILENLKSNSEFVFLPTTAPFNPSLITSIKINLIVEETVKGRLIQVRLNSQAKLRNRR